LIADFVSGDTIQQIEQTANGLADRELIRHNDTSVLFVFSELDLVKGEIVRGIEGQKCAIVFRREL
jgi:hypothetical protein